MLSSSVFFSTPPVSTRYFYQLANKLLSVAPHRLRRVALHVLLFIFPTPCPPVSDFLPHIALFHCRADCDRAPLFLIWFAVTISPLLLAVIDERVPDGAQRPLYSHQFLFIGPTERCPLPLCVGLSFPFPGTCSSPELKFSFQPFVFLSCFSPKGMAEETILARTPSTQPSAFTKLAAIAVCRIPLNFLYLKRPDICLQSLRRPAAIVWRHGLGGTLHSTRKTLRMLRGGGVGG